MPGYRIRAGFEDDQRAVAAALFWEAFSGKLGLSLGPEASACRFLERVLDPQFAISAVGEDGRLLGMAGYMTEQGALVSGGLKELRAEYGWIGSLWRGWLLGLLERDVAPGTLLMDGIFVTGAARGRGIGSGLLHQIKAEAGRRGLRRIRLDVIDGNPRARALYEREGFVAGSPQSTGPLRLVFGFRKATPMVCSLPGAERGDEG